MVLNFTSDAFLTGKVPDPDVQAIIECFVAPWAVQSFLSLSSPSLSIELTVPTRSGMGVSITGYLHG